MIEFKPWPKTPRLFRDIVITEKIDGTNAAVHVVRDERTDYEIGDPATNPNAFPADHVINPATGLGYRIGAQSRKRLIRVGDDNFGFAAWVFANAVTLVTTLGEGVHYGEWWGSGIQRGYGLTGGEKRFSLFNVHRYGKAVLTMEAGAIGLGVVPTLYRGPFDTGNVAAVVNSLREEGSMAAPGFMRPEGVITFLSASGQVYKTLLDNDAEPKGAS